MKEASSLNNKNPLKFAIDKLTKNKVFLALFNDSFHVKPMLSNGIITFSIAVKSLSKLFC